MNDALPDGTYDFDHVPSREGTNSMKWDKYGDRDVLPFWVADMDFAAAPPIVEALEERVRHPIYGYTIAPPELDDAVVAHLANEYGWSVDPEWFVYLPGVVCGLAAACRAYVGAGEAVMTNPPIYHHFFDAHQPEHHHLLEVPLIRRGGRWTWDIDAMREAMTPTTRLLTLCTPHNPVGTVFTRDEIRELMQLADAHDLTVVSDEIHADLVIDPDVRHVPTARACPELAERVVTLISASKTWNIAGANCSVAIIQDEARRDAFKAACVSTVPVITPFAYTATLAAYRDGGPWRAALLDYLHANYQLIEERIGRIDGLRLDPLQATYLAWIDATALDLNHAQQWFEERGVGLSSGEQFGQPGYVRLNFACPRARLAEGLDRMARAVADR